MSQIWSIGGGKGGTGKSFIAGNLGILLAKQGHKTLLIDVDFGAANLHTIIGISKPERSISDFLNRRFSTLDETVVSTAIPNLYFISGAMNNLDIANLTHQQKMKLLRNIARLSYDYILLDIGAGTSFNTIDYFMVADSGIFITTPEPTSIENIYRFVRSVYLRKIHQVLRAHDFRTLAEEAERQNSNATISNPEILLYVVKELDPGKGDIVEKALRTLDFKLILNQLRKQDNPNTGELICKIIERHLALRMSFIGNISYDDHVHNSVCKKLPFIDLYPYTRTALDLRECCKKHLSINNNQNITHNFADQL
ncbi:MAG: AAA family ATPase [Syntrophus sp. (in: bacteria)]